MDNLIYLNAHSQIQDELLQSYRQTNLTFQSILLLAGTLLIPQIFTVESNLLFWLLFILFFLISIFALYSTIKFRSVIISRGNDVSYWHKQILLEEQKLLNDQRKFTYFKVYQKHKRVEADYITNITEELKPLSEEEVVELIGKGLGHTRRVIDQNLSYGLIGIWIVMQVIAIIIAFSNWIV